MRTFALAVGAGMAAVSIGAVGVMGQPPARYRGPIIDMHMHAANVGVGPDGKPLAAPVRCMPGPCEAVAVPASSEGDVLRLTLAAMDRHNIVLAFLSGFEVVPPALTANLERVQTWVRAAPGRFIPSAFVSRPGDPPLDRLRREYDAGRIEALGEIASQYYGYPPNDQALAPYFALAAELDLPVHIHTVGIGAPLPTFRPSAGNPLLLEEVLARHPSLRVVVENCAFPFTQEWIAMAYQYPGLYCDLSTTTWIVNQRAFSAHFRTLIEAGLSRRIMFGSDQMQWPETIALAIAAIDTAAFLTAEQRADIFYDNAARFLRLGEAEIAKHHAR